MSKKKFALLIIIFTALTLAITAFIFSNSFKDITASMKDSNAIAGVFAPILDDQNQGGTAEGGGNAGGKDDGQGSDSSGGDNQGGTGEGGNGSQGGSDSSGGDNQGGTGEGGNGSQGGSDGSGSSGGSGGSGEDGEKQEIVISPKLSSFIRKSAHILEFCALGMSVGTLAYIIFKRYSTKHIAAPILYALGVAVTDEFIQSFNDRTSSVRDVLIDFSGAVLGFIVLLAILGIIALVKNKKKQKNTP